MTMRHRLIRGSARRGLAIISAAAMLSTMLAVPALAEHYDDATVLEGDDAIEAALAWSGLSASSDAVAIGRNDVFADNLSSGLIQGLGDGVQLLLTDTDTLDSRVADEIERLGATVAHVLGGEAAISADVEDELEALGLTTHRHAGTTRIETAIDIASKHATDATSAILARSTSSGTDPSQAFADSLAAGAWAAESGMPVLLTQTEELNDNLAAYLEDSAITAVTIVGGTSAVSAAVASDLEALGIDVDRVSGATRFETAVAIAEARGFADSSDATDGVIVVEGQDANSWAGGFAAAGFAANPKPIVLANGDDLPGPTEDFLAAGDAELFCGPLLETAACDAAAEALGLDVAAHTNQAFTVTPSGPAQFEGDTTVASPRNARAFSANVGNVPSVTVRLAQASNVIVGPDGSVSFDRVGATAAFGNPGDAVITKANGVSTSSTAVSNLVPVNGAITFEINGPANGFGNVVPVVYVPGAGGNLIVSQDAADADGDGTQEGKPTSAFGIGGQTIVLPAEAPTQTAIAETVLFIDLARQYFVANGNGDEDLFRFGAGDTFQTDGGSGTYGMTQDQFAAALSIGDIVSTTYNPSTTDIYTITTDLIPAPTNVMATPVDTNPTPDGVPDAIDISFRNPLNFDIEEGLADGQGYLVQRRKQKADGTFEDWATLANANGGPGGGAITFQGGAPTGSATSGTTVTLRTGAPAAGTYQYRVQAEGAEAGGTGVLSALSTASGNLTLTADAAIQGMTLDAAAVLVDTGTDTELNSTDTITLNFSSGIQVATDAAIELVNDAGQRVRVTRGVNTASSGFAVTVDQLVITLNNDPTQVVGILPFAFDPGTNTVQVASISGITSVATGASPNLAATPAVANRTDDGATAAPSQITPANVSANANTDLVTVNIGGAGLATVGAYVRVYNASGALLATSPQVPNQANFTFSVPGLEAGQRLLIIQSTTNTSVGIEGLASDPASGEIATN